MPRNVNELLAAAESGREFEFLYFWCHRKTHGGALEPGCLDQWWPSPIQADNRWFATSEHYMMWRKARLFGDHSSADRILATDHPADAQRIGRHVSNFDDEVWTRHRFNIVLDGNRKKFGQHADLQKFLVSTGDKVLVEASPVDTVWGIGLTSDDRRATEVRHWLGQNLLGFVLMTVRHELREDQRT